MLSKSEIKHLRSLRLKKFRQKYDQFIVEGEKTITELYTSDFTIVELYGIDANPPLNTPDNIPYRIVTQKELEQVSSHKSPSGLLALVNIRKKVHFQTEGLSICLDDIQDPGNLGTIIRIADWYGIKQIICSKNSVDLYNSKTIAATMGSFSRVQVHYENLEEFINGYKGEVFACVMQGKSIYDISLQANTLIIIGNEGQGIRPEILNKSTQAISIPRKGKAESLNAAIATAIICDNLLQ